MSWAAVSMIDQLQNRLLDFGWWENSRGQTFTCHLLQVPTSAELREAAAAFIQMGHDDIANPDWLYVGAIIGHHGAGGELHALVLDLVRRISDQTVRATMKDRDVVQAIMTFAPHTTALQDTALRGDLRKVTLDVAREFNAGAREREDLNDVAPMFFEIALALSARHHEPAASARELADLVDDMVRAWPPLGYSMAARLADSVWILPADQSLSLWRVLLRARENSFRAS